ncbi:ADP-ribosylation factor [Entamoeba marina]
MFSLGKELISLLKKEPNPPFKIMIVGLDGAGKTYYLEYLTSILTNQPLGEIYDISTVGVNTKIFDYNSYNISFWDIGGCKTFRKVWRRYLEETHGIIYCIDSSSNDRLNEAFEELIALKNDEPCDLPIVVVMTKYDIVNSIVEDAIKEFVENQPANIALKTFSIQTAHSQPEEVEGTINWLIGHKEHSS